MIPVVTFVGPSGVGKTTLVEKVVRELKSCGYRVGAAKHTHHPVALDDAGKDSWRFAQAGGEVVALGTPHGLALFDYARGDAPLEQIAALLDGRVDLLVAEGFKSARTAKIAVVRSDVSRTLPCAVDELIAVVADFPLSIAAPCFAFDGEREIALFLVDYFRRAGYSFQPCRNP